MMKTEMMAESAVIWRGLSLNDVQMSGLSCEIIIVECEVKDLLLLTHFLICFLQDSLCLFWGGRFFALRVKEIVEIKQREIRRYISMKGQEIFRV